MKDKFASCCLSVNRQVFLFTLCSLALLYAVTSTAHAQAPVEIRIMPPDHAKFLVGQFFDLRVEATTLSSDKSPAKLVVTIDGRDVSAQNLLENNGMDGKGSIPGRPERPADNAPSNTTNFLLRDYSFKRPGVHRIQAITGNVTQQIEVEVVEWRGSQGHGVSNVILLLGDGMSAGYRTAARVVSRGFIPTNAGPPLVLAGNAPTQGKAKRLLAMDEMEATGMVMTSSLNALVTDSAPGMAAYSTGNKANNNQEGVFPDNTSSPFDNPRVEYLGEYLHRMNKGFKVGIVTTADVTDATPAANAVHTADRRAGRFIAEQFFDERDKSGVSVLMGGGRCHFLPTLQCAAKADDKQDAKRDLVSEFKGAGYRYVDRANELGEIIEQPPAHLLGLFHPKDMTTAFDKVGAREKMGAKYYSDELNNKPEELHDQPMLPDMTRTALAVLTRGQAAARPGTGHRSGKGFFLLVEGASIDKRAHLLDAERAIWDTIEFDNAVRVALDFAAKTNRDNDPTNDTLVVVTADHDCGGFALIGVGNELYYPPDRNKATRDYVATLRSGSKQSLLLFPNYEEHDAQGFPTVPDPKRKLIIGWAAAPDRYENWLSNRRQTEPTIKGKPNPDHDGAEPESDNKTVDGKAIPGIKLSGQIENGEQSDSAAPDDTSSVALDYANHTATDIPLSASGPGSQQFVGVYDNTEGFFKIMNAYGGRFRKRAGPGK